MALSTRATRAQRHASIYEERDQYQRCQIAFGSEPLRYIRAWARCSNVANKATRRSCGSSSFGGIGGSGGAIPPFPTYAKRALLPTIMRLRLGRCAEERVTPWSHTDQNLRDSKFESSAGGRNHLNSRHQQGRGLFGRPIRATWCCNLQLLPRPATFSDCWFR